jgi:hypothetical protein
LIAQKRKNSKSRVPNNLSLQDEIKTRLRHSMHTFTKIEPGGARRATLSSVGDGLWEGWPVPPFGTPKVLGSLKLPRGIYCSGVPGRSDQRPDRRPGVWRGQSPANGYCGLSLGLRSP